MTPRPAVRPMTSVHAQHADGRCSARARAMDAAGKATLHTIPRHPTGSSGCCCGGRSITIDGNTLDTTLQLDAGRATRVAATRD